MIMFILMPRLAYWPRKYINELEHSLSQQGIFWTPKPSKITPQDTKNVGGVVSSNVNFKDEIEIFPFQYNSHNIEKGTPLKNWTPKNCQLRAPTL